MTEQQTITSPAATQLTPQRLKDIAQRAQELSLRHARAQAFVDAEVAKGEAARAEALRLYKTDDPAELERIAAQEAAAFNEAWVNAELQLDELQKALDFVDNLKVTSEK